MPTFTATSAVGDEVAESASGGSAIATTSMEHNRSTAFTDLGGDDFIETALQGMGVDSIAEPSAVAPMPSVLGDESSNSKGEGAGGGDASPPKDT